MTNRLLTILVLLLTTTVLFAQDYSMSLENLTKVSVSAETTIFVKPHDKPTLLIMESENARTNEKAQGLTSINNRGSDNTNFGVEVKKEGNLLLVTGLRERREGGLVIYLPKTMDISVESLANNEIYVTGFSSEIETINYHGATILVDITGPIVVENGNGNVSIQFKELNQSSPMSVVTENGDIDIKLPATTQANITSKVPRGEFYTDFDFERISKSEARAYNRSVKGKINSGGVEINLQNLKGNIYLRKVD